MSSTIMLKPGRPWAISQKDIDNLVAAYDQTLVLTNVCGLVGRAPDTVRSWLKQGHIDHLAQEDTLFAQLFIRLKFCIAQKVIKLEQMLLNTESGWQRYAWMLERTVKRDYSAYGDILEELESKIAELAKSIANRDKVSPKELTQETKNWIKEKIKEKKEDDRT